MEKALVFVDSVVTSLIHTPEVGILINNLNVT